MPVICPGLTLPEHRPNARTTGTVLDAGRGVDDDGAVPKVTTPHTQKDSGSGRRGHRRRGPFLIGASAHGRVESIGDMVYARQGDTAAGDRVSNNIASRICHILPAFVVDQESSDVESSANHDGSISRSLALI